VIPNHIWCSFLNLVHETHDVYIIVDRNDFDLNSFKEIYPNLNFIQIDDIECKNNGFVNANTWKIKKTPTAWDKVFYFFKDIKEQYVWIIEDDVFIKNADIFVYIDNNISDKTDLVVSSNLCKNDDLNNSWLYWHLGDNKLPDDCTLYHSMVCACRLSPQLFKHISNYTDKHNTLFYIEIMINSIAQQYNLQIETPEELSTITCKPNKGEKYMYRYQDGSNRREWISKKIHSKMDGHYMHHPVKPIQLHHQWRQKS
tara:strand:- start:567 stop:1334 length:768 start_codon:yes stop_codon:yes gene_type:complete